MLSIVATPEVKVAVSLTGSRRMALEVPETQFNLNGITILRVKKAGCTVYEGCSVQDRARSLSRSPLSPTRHAGKRSQLNPQLRNPPALVATNFPHTLPRRLTLSSLKAQGLVTAWSLRPHIHESHVHQSK